MDGRAWTVVYGRPCMDGRAWTSVHGRPCMDGSAWTAVHGRPCMDGRARTAVHGRPCMDGRAWTHRPPLGTPRYGEVFLKAAWRGVRPTPLKNPQEQRTTWPHTFESPWTFKRGSPKIWRALPRPLQEDAEGLPKIWRALPRPLAGTAPKGSYFAHRSGLAALGPLLVIRS